MRGIAVVLCLAAGAARGEEKGKYSLSFSGKPAGTEEFRFEEFDDGQSVLHARCKFEIAVQGKPQTVSVDAMLTLDKAGKPLRYAGLESAGGRERRSKIEWRDGAAWPEPRRSVKTAAPFVLDNNVWSQLLPIVRRFEGPRKKLKVFSPATMGDLELAIDDKGEVLLRGKEAVIRARELLLTLGPQLITVHLDEKKRPIRISSPLSGALAELEGFEGFVPVSLLESKVSIPSGERRIEGALTTETGAKGAPALLLLPDGKGDLLLGSLSASLAGAGFTVLRLDDGEPPSDAEAALAWLRGREEVGALGILGHGEGATVALALAARDPKVRALLLLAAASKPYDQVLLERMAAELKQSGSKESAIAPILEGQKAVFRRIRESTEDWLEIDERRTYVAGLRERFRQDPAATLASLKVPVAIFHGTADRELAPSHAEALAAARPGSELRLLEGLDHRFRKGEAVDAEFLKVLAERAGALLR